MDTKSIWATPEERRGDLIGIVMWIVWYLTASFLLSLAIHDAQTHEFYYTPFFLWIAFGPLLAFLSIGRHLLRIEPRMVTGPRSYIRNAMTSSVSFIAWAIALLSWGHIFEGMYDGLSTIGGLSFTYIVLVIYNRKLIK